MFLSEASRQKITFFTTLNFHLIFNLLKLCGSCSGVVQYMAQKREVITLQIINVKDTATYNGFFYRNKDKLGLEKPASLSLEVEDNSFTF